MRIKISLPNDFPLWRQLPDFKCNRGIEYLFNAGTNEPVDYWIIYDGIKKEETQFCIPDNIWLFTGEPSAVKTYRKDFISQFGLVLTCHEKIRHSNKTLTHPSLPWLVGIKYNIHLKTFNTSEYLKYSDFKNNDFGEKQKLISLISSKKTYTKGHKARVKFIELLKSYFGDKLDVYGDGYTPIPDKLDALSNYKYSIVIENSSEDHYWSEKLADCYLANTYPIYFGCPNLHTYFPRESFHRINLFEPKKSIKSISTLIENNTFDKYKAKIDIAKNKILDEYNLFSVVNKLLDESKGSKDISYKKITIHPEKFNLIDRVQRKLKWL